MAAPTIDPLLIKLIDNYAADPNQKNWRAFRTLIKDHLEKPALISGSETNIIAWIKGQQKAPGAIAAIRAIAHCGPYPASSEVLFKFATAAEQWAQPSTSDFSADVQAWAAYDLAKSPDVLDDAFWESNLPPAADGTVNTYWQEFSAKAMASSEAVVRKDAASTLDAIAKKGGKSLDDKILKKFENALRARWDDEIEMDVLRELVHALGDIGISHKTAKVIKAAAGHEKWPVYDTVPYAAKKISDRIISKDTIEPIDKSACIVTLSQADAIWLGVYLEKGWQDNIQLGLLRCSEMLDYLWQIRHQLKLARTEAATESDRKALDTILVAHDAQMKQLIDQINSVFLPASKNNQKLQLRDLNYDSYRQAIIALSNAVEKGGEFAPEELRDPLNSKRENWNPAQLALFHLLTLMKDKNFHDTSSDNAAESDNLDRVRARAIRSIGAVQNPNVKGVQAIKDLVTTMGESQLKLMLADPDPDVRSVSADVLAITLGAGEAAAFFADLILDEPGAAEDAAWFSFLTWNHDIGRFRPRKAPADYSQRARNSAAKALPALAALGGDDKKKEEAFKRINDAAMVSADTPRAKRARQALAAMGTDESLDAFIGANFIKSAKDQYFEPIKKATEQGDKILQSTRRRSFVTWIFTLIIAAIIVGMGLYLFGASVQQLQIDQSQSAEREKIAVVEKSLDNTNTSLAEITIALESLAAVVDAEELDVEGLQEQIEAFEPVAESLTANTTAIAESAASMSTVDWAPIAAALTGLAAAVAGLLIPFFWNPTAAIQKANSQMASLITSTYGYFSRMTMIGLGFAHAYTTTDVKKNLEVMTIASQAAGTAMTDSVLVMSGIGSWPGGGRTVEVPDLKARKWDEAAVLAQERGLSVTMKAMKYDDTTIAEKVLEQSPAAGTLTDIGTIVGLTLSKGKKAGDPETAPVPELKEKTFAEAETLVKALGLDITAVSIVQNDDIAKDKIISSDPAAGKVVNVGTAITVTMSSGPIAATVTVPDFVALLTWAEAKKEADKLGLVLVPGEQEYSDKPEGNITKQNPDPKDLVKPGETIELSRSKGMKLFVTVPDFKGKTWASAEEQAVEEGLVPEKKQEYSGKDTEKDKVYKQEPPAGQLLAPKAKVSIYISLGVNPATAVVPDLLSTPVKFEDAKNLIKAAALTVGDITMASSPTPVGIITDQMPKAPTKLIPGDKITLTVSTGP